MKHPSGHLRLVIGVLTLLLAALAPTPLAGESAPPAESSPEGDLEAARSLFERNLNAIRQRDRQAYLACYLNSEDFIRVGPAGPQMGYEPHATLSSDDSWPDLFEGVDLRLVPIRPGVVFGTYRYRVVYGNDELSGISERIFLDTPDGWRIAMSSAFTAPAGTPPPARALTGATLIDGTGAPPIPDAVVVLRGGRVECAGTRQECPIPEDVVKTELPGYWITPGLIDAHVHFSQTGWADGRPDFTDVREFFPYEAVMADLRAHPDRFFGSYLCSGVTGVFDVAGYPWTLDLPDQAEGNTLAPHVAATGPALSTVDHWLNLPGEKQLLYLKDEATARSLVKYLAALEVDAVKGRGSGRRLGGRRSGTAPGGARHRAEGGEGGPPGRREDAGPQRRGPARGRRVPPDGKGPDDVGSKEPSRLDDPLKCVDPSTRARLSLTPAIRAEHLRQAPKEPGAGRSPMTASGNLKQIHEAGITVAMGTDAGNPLTLPGVSVFDEMMAMEAAGMSPMDVIVAATRGGAMAMGRLGDMGTVERGKAADLLVLGADPTETVANFRALMLVARGGVVRLQPEHRAPLR
jgi:hypothetical protein